MRRLERVTLSSMLCSACGKPVALHFSARGRKLDCARVTDTQTALRRAKREAKQLAHYISRLESL